MSFLSALSGVGSFLGSASGQQLLGAAGQIFKVKELGWQPGAKLTPQTTVAAPTVAAPVVAPVARGPAGPVGVAGPTGVEGLPGAPPLGNGGVDPFGGRFVHLAGRAAETWRSFREMPTQPIDIISAGQYDDAETAKLAIKHAVIPADSDYGIALQAGGAKVTKRRVRFSDGTVRSIPVIEVKGARKRKRRNYATRAGIRNAARVMRQMGQMVRSYDRLASLGARVHRALHPKRTPAHGHRVTHTRRAPPRRRTRK